MQATLTLLPESGAYINEQIQEVYAGVLASWRKLPEKVQDHVLSAEIGIIAGAIGTNVTVAWELVISDHLETTITKSFWFSLDVSTGISTRTEDIFTKVVYKLLEEIAEGTKQNAMQMAMIITDL